MADTTGGERETAGGGMRQGSGADRGGGADAGAGATAAAQRAFARFVDGLDYPMFVVTVADPRTGERSGCLVGFATQCGIDPPRFLTCLSVTNHTYRVASSPSVRTLAVHRLRSDQHELAALFGAATGDTVDKFARCDWEPGPDGVPLLSACEPRLAGTVLARIDLGDHTGFLLAPAGADASGGPGPAGAEPRGESAERQGGPLMFSQVRDLDAGHPA